MGNIDPIAMKPPVADRSDLVAYGEEMVEGGRYIGCREIRRLQFLAM